MNATQTKQENAMNEMNSVQTVAVAKAIKDAASKDASGKLTVGVHTVDFTVRVKGTITKGEDYEQDIVAKADPWLLLAAALSKLNGVTVDALVREAVSADEALIDGLKAKAADAIQAMKVPTKTKCNGKVTTKLAVVLA